MVIYYTHNYTNTEGESHRLLEKAIAAYLNKYADSADPEKSVVPVDLRDNALCFPIMKVSKVADKHLRSLLHFAQGFGDLNLILFRNTVLLNTGVTFLSITQCFCQPFHGIKGLELFRAVFSGHHSLLCDLQ